MTDKASARVRLDTVAMTTLLRVRVILLLDTTMCRMLRGVGLVLLWLLLASASPVPQRRSEPFVPIGVWYGGGTVRAPMLVRDPAPERARWQRDLQAIRALGFNSIKGWVDWASVEPQRGQYRFDALD